MLLPVLLQPGFRLCFRGRAALDRDVLHIALVATVLVAVLIVRAVITVAAIATIVIAITTWTGRRRGRGAASPTGTNAFLLKAVSILTFGFGVDHGVFCRAVRCFVITIAACCRQGRIISGRSGAIAIKVLTARTAATTTLAATAAFAVAVVIIFVIVGFVVAIRVVRESSLSPDASCC